MSKTESTVDPKTAIGESEYREIDLEHLVEAKNNPRRMEGELDLGDLVESIKKYGVITPLIVRPVGNDRKFEVMAGTRRSRAARQVGLKTVPCRVVKVENDAALEVVVVENLQRKNLHPLEEADGFHEILDLSNGDLGALGQGLEGAELHHEEALAPQAPR